VTDGGTGVFVYEKEPSGHGDVREPGGSTTLYVFLYRKKNLICVYFWRIKLHLY
jgi:hypothetical protein